MRAKFALIVICASFKTLAMERFTPRLFCNERVAHAQTISMLSLPISISTAIGAHLYDPSSTLSALFTTEATIHTLFTGALWAVGKLGRNVALSHDTEKYEKRSQKSKIAPSHQEIAFKADYQNNDLAVPDEIFGLVPNDLYQWSQQGSWSRRCSKYLNESILPEITPDCIETFIRKEYTFEPTKINDPTPLVIVVTHGTFGSQTASYYKDYAQFPMNTGISPQNYRHIERFATRLGDAQGQVVHLLSFRWSGDLDNSERIIAGKVLATIINKNFPNSALVLIGHSHGCNVNRHATQILLNGVNMLIHFAPPYRSEKEYIPQNIARSISFTSPYDIIAHGGQVPENILIPISPLIETGILATIGHTFPSMNSACLATEALIWSTQLIKALPYFLKDPISAPQEGRFMDIRIRPTIDGKSLGHSEMANMSRYLWPLWCAIGLKQGSKKMNALIKTNPPSITLEEMANS